MKEKHYRKYTTEMLEPSAIFICNICKNEFELRGINLNKVITSIKSDEISSIICKKCYNRDGH